MYLYHNDVLSVFSILQAGCSLVWLILNHNVMRIGFNNNNNNTHICKAPYYGVFVLGGGGCPATNCHILVRGSALFETIMSGGYYVEDSSMQSSEAVWPRLATGSRDRAPAACWRRDLSVQLSKASMCNRSSSATPVGRPLLVHRVRPSAIDH